MISRITKFYKNNVRIKINFNEYYFYFINIIFFSIFRHGKKFLAEKIFCFVLNLLKKSYKKKLKTFFDFFKKIYKKIYSPITFKTQHVGKTKYLIPIISIGKSIFLARQWFFKSLKLRSERTYILKILGELKDLKKGVGSTLFYKSKHNKQAYDFRINRRLLKYSKFNPIFTSFKSKFKLIIKKKTNFFKNRKLNHINFSKKK